MSILKYLERVKRMDDLIRRKATGPADAFARKLGISRSTLMYNLGELKALGASICFDDIIQSYYYAHDFELFDRKAPYFRHIKGGKNLFENFSQSSPAGLRTSIFTFVM